MPCPVRANQTVRSWIPHPTTHIGVVENVSDLWGNRPEKVSDLICLDILENLYCQAVTIKYFFLQTNPVYSRLCLPPVCTMVIHLTVTLSQVDIRKYIQIKHVLVYSILSIKGSKLNQLKLMSYFSVDTGHKTYQHATSSAPQGQLQSLTHLVIGGRKRCPSVPAFRERSLTIPVQPYTMPLYPDNRLQPQMKGMSSDFLCANFQ